MFKTHITGIPKEKEKEKKSRKNIFKEGIAENLPKGHKETLRGDGNVLYFDCGGGFMGVYIHQNASN